MKTLLSTLAILAFTSTAAQAVDFVNQDGSELSQLCIAAVESDQALTRQASAQNISRIELESLSCNDMPLQDFVAEYRNMVSDRTVKVTAFENADNSVESELCIAAATSNSAYQQTKNRYKVRVNAEQVACNGERLTTFAKQFNRAFND